MKKRADLRILLLQIRKSPLTRKEEHESFARYGGVELEQIDVLNVFDTPKFSTDVLDGYDAFFVGGTSDACVLEPEKSPFLEYAKELLLHCIKIELPVFASCFGFQIAAVALGAKIVKDEKDYEMGVIPINLTSAAKDDPLFCDTPDGFFAISVHQKRAPKAPPGCELLAYTEPCCQSFRVKDKPFWAFQFHPEVNKQTLIDRLTLYKEQYTDDDEHLTEVLANAVEVPEAYLLVKKFIDRILLKKST